MIAPAGIPSPLDFFGKLDWIDGRPLSAVIEPYRARIFTEALYTFDVERPDVGTFQPAARPTYNQVLAGRGKKNWKSADLVLAAFYRFFAWPSAAGNDCFLLANDSGQASDDLTLAKKIIAANPILDHAVEVKTKEIERKDGGGLLQVLPAQDTVGSHGKTYLFVGFDEVHGYKNWDLFEALAPDPTRPDALTWITTYASIYNRAGAPLYDMTAAAKRGDDPRMFFSWYSGDYCTDPDLADAEPEVRANPSMESWGNPGYLAQQRRRLPSHKYRRLHLNLPGLPDGAALSAEHVLDAIVKSRKRLSPVAGRRYSAFVDMSGGSSDDATLAIAHHDQDTERAVLDLVVSQAGKPPFNPRRAVLKFAGILKEYSISRVLGDRYAGETFRQDFQDAGVSYQVCKTTKSALYEGIEPLLNAGEVELLDTPKLQEQLLGLVWRGSKIDHMTGEHDDFANAAAGALIEAASRCVNFDVSAYAVGRRLVGAEMADAGIGWSPRPSAARWTGGDIDF